MKKIIILVVWTLSINAQLYDFARRYGADSRIYNAPLYFKDTKKSQTCSLGKKSTPTHRTRKRKKHSTIN